MIEVASEMKPDRRVKARMKPEGDEPKARVKANDKAVPDEAPAKKAPAKKTAKKKAD